MKRMIRFIITSIIFINTAFSQEAKIETIHLDENTLYRVLKDQYKLKAQALVKVPKKHLDKRENGALEFQCENREVLGLKSVKSFNIFLHMPSPIRYDISYFTITPYGAAGDSESSLIEKTYENQTLEINNPYFFSTLIQYKNTKEWGANLALDIKSYNKNNTLIESITLLFNLNKFYTALRFALFECHMKLKTPKETT